MLQKSSETLLKVAEIGDQWIKVPLDRHLSGHFPAMFFVDPVNLLERPRDRWRAHDHNRFIIREVALATQIVAPDQGYLPVNDHDLLMEQDIFHMVLINARLLRCSGLG
jgi:hypothetical protein